MKKDLKSLNRFTDEKIGKQVTENREHFETEHDTFQAWCTYSAGKGKERSDTGIVS